MGIDIIIKYIENELKIKINEYNDTYYYITDEGKIIFFIGYTCLNEINKFIDTLDIDDFYDDFSQQLKENDKKEYINFKAFLWDLYIIAINCGKEGSITNEEKFKLEKDRFLARKIIINFINNKIIESISHIIEKNVLDDDNVNKDEKIEVENRLNKLLDKVKMILEPEKQLDKFIELNQDLDDSVETFIKEKLLNKDLKDRIDSIVKRKDISLKDKISEYLLYISNIKEDEEEFNED